MPEIHVINGRLYAADGSGVVVRENQLALLESSGTVAFLTSAVVGAQSYATRNGAITATNDGRLRVDTKPTDETVNLFDAPSAFDGSPWSSKSPW